MIVWWLKVVWVGDCVVVADGWRLDVSDGRRWETVGREMCVVDRGG